MQPNEGSILIRPAEPRDAGSLASLHLACSSVQPGGFMHRLGRKFFVKYYEILLRERTTVILCADAGKDGIVGLVSATLDSRKQLEAIRRGRLQLLLAVIPALVRAPSLAWEVWVRNRALSPRSSGDEYFVSSGARIVYWGWSPGHRSHPPATSLITEVLRRLEELGARSVSLETDRLNRKVEVMHRLMGAHVSKVLVTRDGRERTVLEYALRPKVGEIPAR
jgi:hypothetical protein